MRAFPLADLMDRWRSLGDAGVTVSICCGPMLGKVGTQWSVLAAAKGEEFDRPMRAKGFYHCVEIAEIEAKQRGWIP